MNVVLVVVLVAVLLGQPGPAAVMYGFTDGGEFVTTAGDDPAPIGDDTIATAMDESNADDPDAGDGLVDGFGEPPVPPGVVVFTARRESAVNEDEDEGESDALDSEPRAMLYEAIAGSPGLSMTEVAEETDIPLSTARYHSRVLTNEDVIDEEKIRGKRRLFPAAMGPDQRELAAAMADDATASLLAATFHLEPVGVCELATELDRSASTVSYHLTRLEDAGLLERERDGDCTVTRLDPAVRSALDPDGATLDADVVTRD